MTSFENFIKGSLINHNVVTGVVLLTNHGQVVYSHGTLQQILQAEFRQFLNLFNTRLFSNAVDGNTVVSHLKDFSINCGNRQPVSYKTYQRTYCSIYATATGHSGGLVVCNIPYGILVCVYDSSTNPGDAIKSIEQFCDIMRR